MQCLGLLLLLALLQRGTPMLDPTDVQGTGSGPELDAQGAEQVQRLLQLAGFPAAAAEQNTREGTHGGLSWQLDAARGVLSIASAREAAVQPAAVSEDSAAAAAAAAAAEGAPALDRRRQQRLLLAGGTQPGGKAAAETGGMLQQLSGGNSSGGSDSSDARDQRGSSSAEFRVAGEPGVEGPDQPEGLDEEEKEDALSYLAFCLFTRGQHGDLPEWLDHHLALGASFIYLVDDGSEPPLLPLALPYVRRGAAEYVRLLSGHEAYRLNGKSRPQQWSYNWCLRERGSRHKWLGFVDSDEFVMFRDGSRDLPGHLRRYEAFGGLALNWWAYGSGGHDSRPPGGAVANYVRCHRGERSVKTIAQPAWALAFNRSVHNPEEYGGGRYTVNERRERVEGPFSPPDPLTQVAFVAHYVLKSREDYRAKLARGGGVKRNARSPQFFEALDASTLAEPPCNESLAYVHPLLRRA